MLENYEIEIASIPTQENLVAEIFYNGIQWTQIYQQNRKFLIHFYPHPRQQYWEFPFDIAVQILEKAKKKLLDVS